MPYAIKKVPNKNCWTVKNSRTGKVHARCTSKTKAEAQKRLLLGVEHGMKTRKR